MKNKQKILVVSDACKMWELTYKNVFPDAEVSSCTPSKASEDYLTNSNHDFVIVCPLLENDLYKVLKNAQNVKDKTLINISLDIGNNTTLMAYDMGFKAVFDHFDSAENFRTFMKNKNTDSLEILVVEDNETNMTAAKEAFSDCKGYFIKNYDGARAFLQNNKVDVLLTDLMMPKGTNTGMSEKATELSGEQMPYGFAIALQAAKENVPNIAVITDANHHEHPMIWATDPLAYGPLKVENSVLRFYQRSKDKPEYWKEILNDLRAKI